jgi:hypothetical protein
MFSAYVERCFFQSPYDRNTFATIYLFSYVAEDATFHIYSKCLHPDQTPTEVSFNTTPAKTGAAAPSDGDLSAAGTPEKEASSSSLPPATLSFDPSFGAAASSSGSDVAANTLLAELISQGVIPSGMGSEVDIQSLSTLLMTSPFLSFFFVLFFLCLEETDCCH